MRKLPRSRLHRDTACKDFLFTPGRKDIPDVLKESLRGAPNAVPPQKGGGWRELSAELQGTMQRPWLVVVLLASLFLVSAILAGPVAQEPGTPEGTSQPEGSVPEHPRVTVQPSYAWWKKRILASPKPPPRPGMFSPLSGGVAGDHSK